MTVRTAAVDYYDVVVVGAGPAGMMAAIRAAQLKKNVALVERNASVGRKILITGKGRCNLTNTADMDSFMQKFGKQGQFLRSAFYEFFNNDLIDFFKEYGLSAKAERQGRVFPSDDKSMSVVRALEKALAETGVNVFTGSRVMGIRNDAGIFHVKVEGRTEMWTNRLILATGGASYKATGSTGDGVPFREIARPRL